MSHVAVIVGISGREFFLRQGEIVSERQRAQGFRTERGAATAANAHIKTFSPCVARNMAFRVEPRS